MDLFAPCRSCLQCLPFFNVSPPSSPRPAVAATPSSSSPYSEEASKATSTDQPQSSEELPCSNEATSAQEQDLQLLSKEEEDLPQDAICDKDKITEKLEDEQLESGALSVPEIVIAPAVSASSAASFVEDVEDNKTPTISELPLKVPFINDVTFSAPLSSPITPVPFGEGHPPGQYPPYGQIYHDQHQGHVHPHDKHENSHHGHDHSVHSHESPHVECASSHHGHNHSHHGHSHVQSAPDSDVPPLQVPDSEIPDSDVPPLQVPLDESQVIHGVHEDTSFHRPYHDNLDSSTADDGNTAYASLDNEHPHLEQIDDVSLTTPSEILDLDLKANVGIENSVAGYTNGASAVLETYHSEPVVVFGGAHDDENAEHGVVLGHSGSHPPHHHRHRDHFREQLKGIKQQIKQGGHHAMEEGGKHMKNIIENINKQAQEIEQSGSFFMVPHK